MNKLPEINCHNCQKPMILINKTKDDDKYIFMKCPQECSEQPVLTLQAFGPFWKPITPFK